MRAWCFRPTIYDERCSQETLIRNRSASPVACSVVLCSMVLSLLPGAPCIQFNTASDGCS